MDQNRLSAPSRAVAWLPVTTILICLLLAAGGGRQASADTAVERPPRNGSAAGPPALSWFPKAPPLHRRTGQVIAVSNLGDLYLAAQRVQPGGTILIADGHYMLSHPLMLTWNDVTLRSRSGDRNRVVLDGARCDGHDLLEIHGCSGVTIADLTIQNAAQNGFKLDSDSGVNRVTIYNCVSHNVWQRHVKGVPGLLRNGRREGSAGCKIQYCLFYNDRPKRQDDDPFEQANPKQFGINYVGGIDVMNVKNWSICDNVFVGIQGATREARGAIFIWHGAKDVIIERNAIIDCDCGICLGNSSRGADWNGIPHCASFLVRNNFITRCPEGNIFAAYTKDCRILHNSVHDPASRMSRLLRTVAENDNLVVANNIFSGPGLSLESPSHVELRDNLVKPVPGYFVDGEGGNLHLTGQATGAIGKAAPCPEVPEDFDRRPWGEKPDLGAHQFTGRLGSAKGLETNRTADNVKTQNTETGRAGGTIVYHRWAEMTIPDKGHGTSKSIELNIRNSENLKVAFLARGTGGVKTAQFNLFDEQAKDNTTSDAYRWVGEPWRPVVYQIDRFVYNGAMNRRIAPQATFRSLDFHGNKTPDGKGILELRNLVIYRGGDISPPAAPAGMSAEGGAEGVRLAWKVAADDVGVAWYVVSRAAEGGPFSKVGQTCETVFLARPAAAGTYRYRVLAVDFDGNLGPWSEEVRVAASQGFEPPVLSAEERDRLGYGENVRAIAAAGREKVVRHRVLCFGDSITYANSYRQFVESALGCYDVWARGYEGQRTDFGRKQLDHDLQEIKPELCLIMLGTNNSKAARDIPVAMDDLLAMARICRDHSAIPIIATIPPRGFTDPRSVPEAGYNQAVVTLCHNRKIPVAYVFQAFQAGSDRRKLLASDGVHLQTGGWEVTARAWQAAVEQVNFALLDR